MTQINKGFSKLSKEEKIDWIVSQYFTNPQEAKQTVTQYWNSDENIQKLHDEFIENTISNFYLPLGVAPNFIINGKNYTIPMAVEESSVVAAAAKAAKFWSERGGFKATVLNTEKIGQVHFLFSGNFEKLNNFFQSIKTQFFADTENFTKNMQKRGGGILDITLVDKTNELPNYYQLHATFNTKDSMGANFINTCLEQFAKTLENQAQHYDAFTEEEKKIQIIMSILSNYVPNCVVRAEVSCPVEQLSDDAAIDSKEFAEKFVTAIKIAEIEPYTEP
jgi:hydroxymethylglutaryl-CoA reductase